MWQRDKLFQKYYKETNLERKELLHVKYMSLRSELTKKKRNSKTNYYQVYFANNSRKVSAIWKGIRMVVKIKSYSNRDILILDNNGSLITDPIEICNHFNQNFVSMGQKIDAKISVGKYHYTKYLKNIRINKTFFLRPVKLKEIYDIILSLDLNKSLGPNSIPIFVMKLCN